MSENTITTTNLDPVGYDTKEYSCTDNIFLITKLKVIKKTMENKEKRREKPGSLK